MKHELYPEGCRVRRKKLSPEIAVVAGDFHFDYHDKHIVALFLSFLSWLKPDTVIINGDLVDFYEISRFSKDPKRIGTLQHELDIAKYFLEEVRRILPRSHIIYMAGNHDARMNEFLKNHPNIASLRALTLESLLTLHDLGIQFIPYEERLHFGDLVIWHGDKANKHAAASYLNDWVVSGIFNHKHNMQVMHKRSIWRDDVVVMNGCMCDMNQAYIKGGEANWQHGWCVVQRVGNNRSVIEPIRVVDGRFLYHSHSFVVGKK